MEDNIILLLKQLHLSLEQYGREQMKGLDLSPAQSLALGYLFSRKGHTVYATELHGTFGISKSAISSTLKGLKKNGYIETTVNPKDDRKKQIILTDKALMIEAQIHTRMQEQQSRLCRNIPQPHLEIMENGLHTMLANLKEEHQGRDSIC